MLRRRSPVAIVTMLIASALLSAAPATQPANVSDTAAGAKGLESAISKLHAPTRNTAPLPASESLKQLHPREGLAVDLIASEPIVRQPLHLTFDDRGRMWLTQYIQYPFPKGLKIVDYDRWLRAKFDKTPPPPPAGERGADLITILEDEKGDGSFSKVSTFLSGGNITTASLPDKGGVWVMNPPYLLFYPTGGGDVPNGDPVVHLSGFGLEDTHAVASSLTWGPDGWIYGANGSTTTCKIRVEVAQEKRTTDFLGQAIWRYHPVRHVFEIFAEGGGNTFGVAFDDKGRLYSGTNWGTWRGVHYVQGGYYIKNWGKHGPLTNPYAFGNLEHMPHTGDAVRLTHTFSVYNGGLLGPEYEGKLIGPNALMSRVQVTKLDPIGSTYKTVEEPFMVTSTDGWFRPVGIATGPDGAIYIADFYENRISHVDPRDNWDRSNGRVYRLRPTDWKPGIKPFDLRKMSNDELLKLLSHQNRWFRDAARRVIGERQDDAIVPQLVEMLGQNSGQLALEAFWALHLLHGLDDATLHRALVHPDPFVRMWAVRTVGDRAEPPSPRIANSLYLMATLETDPQVRSQLASTAKRLPARISLPVLHDMLQNGSDALDPHIPLLMWWAVESKAVSDRETVVRYFLHQSLWKSPTARDVVYRRLARRYASEPTPENQDALVRLLAAAPGDDERNILVAGLAEAFEGRTIKDLAPPLATALAKSGNLEVALRSGDRAALAEAVKIATDEKEKSEKRVRYLALLGQTGHAEIAPALLAIVEKSKTASVRREALAALSRFEAPAIGEGLAALLPKLPVNLRGSVVAVLVGRKPWAESLLKAVQTGAVAKAEVAADQVERMRHVEENDVFAPAVDAVFGKPQRPSSAEKEQEIARIRKVIGGGGGDATAGKVIFTARCAVCHTLFKDGAKIGPDLTTYNRRDLDFVLLSIVDPSAVIREEYTAFHIKTTGGQLLEGLITERGSAHINLMDTAGQKTVIPKTEIKEERAMTTSLMPEELLAGLSEQELRDFFTYLASEKAPEGK